MPRALASLTLSFGLVSIPVRLYNATEPAPGVRFRLLTPEGTRIRQQYVAESAPAPPIEMPPTAPSVAPLFGRPGSTPALAAALATRATEEARTAAPAAPALATSARTGQSRDASRAPSAQAAVDEPANSEVDDEIDQEAPADVRRPAAPAVARERLVKGYEFEKGRFVTFTPDELQALASPRRDTIDIVAFVPEHSVDPLYHDKGYYLAPERRGARPYALLLEALRQSRRSAIAKWAWRGRETIAEIRPVEGGLVLQQLRYADEVRAIDDLHIELEPVGRAELELALQLVEHNAEPSYAPERFVDEEQARIRAAIERKVAGQRIVEPETPRVGEGAQVIDLMAALRASLQRPLAQDAGSGAPPPAATPESTRKPARRAKVEPSADVERSANVEANAKVQRIGSKSAQATKRRTPR